jgi:predicted small secreted protein
MKKTALFLLLSITLLACNNKKGIPDVSSIPVSVKLERFEKDFFNIDSTAIPNSLRQLKAKYPGFYPDYMQGILGVSGADTNLATQQAVMMMLENYKSLYDIIEPKFDNTSGLEKNLKQGFQFVNYYFPEYRVPGIITFIGTLDAPGMVLTNQYIAVGLHQYAGKDFPGYLSKDVQQIYPLYISRRFDPIYIPANCMKAVVSDLFPDNSNAKPLIDQMIEKGKQWWLLDKFLPETPDSLKTGYTLQQLNWCKANEGLIWSYLVKNEDLNSVSPATIQVYIGEGPFTQVFSQEYSPGNIGQWIGWQIVKKFAAKNPGMKPADIMLTESKKILEEAKYKPK